MPLHSLVGFLNQRMLRAHTRILTAGIMLIRCSSPLPDSSSTSLACIVCVAIRCVCSAGRHQPADRKRPLALPQSGISGCGAGSLPAHIDHTPPGHQVARRTNPAERPIVNRRYLREQSGELWPAPQRSVTSDSIGIGEKTYPFDCTVSNEAAALVKSTVSQPRSGGGNCLKQNNQPEICVSFLRIFLSA